MLRVTSHTFKPSINMKPKISQFLIDEKSKKKQLRYAQYFNFLLYLAIFIPKGI